MALYKDMTPAERQAAYNEYAEAVEVHVTCFAIRPPYGSREDRLAIKHADFCAGRMRLIAAVARKAGDAWVTKR